MTPNPVGATVATIEYQYRLSIVTTDGWYLTVENDFGVRAGGSMALERSSEEDLDSALALLQMGVGTEFRAFDIDPQGSLTVLMGDVELHVLSADDFEAWDLVGPPPAKQRIVCMPGGELAIWS